MYKNPNKRRIVNLSVQRRRRSGGGEKPSPPSGKRMRIRTARDVARVIEEQINLLRSSGADPIIVARAIARLCDVCLRAIEVSDLAARIATLEGKLGHDHESTY